jgi:hypothetical protein
MVDYNKTDVTPIYLPFIYKLTNGHPELIIAATFLETIYVEIMDQLRADENYKPSYTPDDLEFTLPRCDHIYAEDDDVPGNLFDQFDFS